MFDHVLNDSCLLHSCDQDEMMAWSMKQSPYIVWVRLCKGVHTSKHFVLQILDEEDAANHSMEAVTGDQACAGYILKEVPL